MPPPPSPNRPLLLCALAIALGAASAVHATAQTPADGGLDVSTTELVPGSNTIVLRAPHGILTVRTSSSRHTRVGHDEPLHCIDTLRLDVSVDDPSGEESVRVLVRDCAGRDYEVRLEQRVTWRISRVDAGEMAPGEERCVPMVVAAGAGSIRRAETIDSITVEAGELRGLDRLPIRLEPGETFHYELCLTAASPGAVLLPVVVHIRRPEGNGTFAIADTVVAEIVAPRPTPVDPTVFRTIAAPSALVIPRGRVVAGSYDLLGYLAAYAPIDGVMVMAGGMLPLPGSLLGSPGESRTAHSIGIKGSIEPLAKLSIAAGLQWGRSTFDIDATTEDIESAITVLAPYLAATWGDDRGHLSLTASLGTKNHRTYVPQLDLYNDYTLRLAVVAVGGDIVIARGWKVAAEAAWMETAGVLPIGATLRYFTNELAVEAGLVYAGRAVLPLLTFLVRL